MGEGGGQTRGEVTRWRRHGRGNKMRKKGGHEGESARGGEGRGLVARMVVGWVKGCSFL